ncbi:hypothetical protein BH23GEM3_BH23GEM3_10510 [soil metagenome]|nr:hypothetical protein [Gemmatimonadota bacterium]
MSKRASEAPPARLALVFHTPTIARVNLVYQRAAGRVARAVFWWVVCWGALPLLIWVPPHYPWVFTAFAAGLYLPYQSWTGRYRVRSFSGFCPRCGQSLHLREGSRIDLPHRLTCFHCHFEPVLEIVATSAASRPHVAEPVRIHHRHADCPGRWMVESTPAPASVACSSCGARHCATPAARRAAEEENRSGAVLADLTTEGRFLI